MLATAVFRIIYNTGVAIKTLWYWVAFLSLASAADWINQGTVQKDEKQLTVANVHKLKLLWKRPLDSALTSPVMLGPIVTHRGIKELVFVAAASNTLYAVDADLGRVFWTRRFDGPGTLTATPAIAPYTNPNPNAEWSTPLRPIYVATGDGMLHTQISSCEIKSSNAARMGSIVSGRLAFRAIIISCSLRSLAIACASARL